MSNFASDLKHSFRLLRRSPGFTLTAIGALTLGIGANTAIFSVVNTVLLKPLPYPDPDRIVQLRTIGPQGGFGAASVPKFNAWRAQSQALEDVAAYDTGGPGINITAGDRPESRTAATARATVPSRGVEAAIACARVRRMWC